MSKYRKNKRDFKVPKRKYEGQFHCLPLYGFYAYNEEKRRVIRYYGRNHKWVRTHFNHQLRREIRQMMIDREDYDNIPDRKGDMWHWD